MTKHIQSLYVAWSEGKLKSRTEKRVKAHLETCQACRSYFEKMDNLLKEKNLSALPYLQADPYLATRVKALAREEQHPSLLQKYRVWMRWAGIIIYSAAALWLGIYLGSGISTSTTYSPESELVEAYYQTISDNSLGDRLESLINTNGEESP